VLPILRSIYSAYGSVSVIHFDSHLDTWKPSVFGGAPSAQAAVNHGTYFYWASLEGLIKNGSSIASVFCSESSSFFFFFFYHPLNTLILVYSVLTARRHSNDPFWPSGL
jgi:agmatinase